MTHLIFKRVSVKFEVRREKRGRKKKVHGMTLPIPSQEVAFDY
jgi:hypothetical protein